MIVLVIPLVFLIFAEPFGGPAQSVIEVLYLVLLLGITIHHTVRSLRNADEVQLAGANYTVSVGALMALACTSATVLVVPNAPFVADLITSLAVSPGSELPPAAAGFLLGMLACIVLGLVSAVIANAVWASQMARQ